MHRILSLFVLAASLFAAAPKKPKLILTVVIDQFRYDYLTRFRSEYHGGLDRLLTRGAVFTNAQYISFPTVTAVGHSTILSGATPSVSGIVGNDWFDREENKHVTSVSDSRAKLLGGKPAAEGASPRRLLVSTVGDELKMSNGGKSHVIGISLKDRSAILPAGHTADAAYWFDLNSGNFVSSDYYFRELPRWVTEFNDQRLGDKHRGDTWMNHKLPDDLVKMYGNSTLSPFESSTFGNDVLEQFVEKALAAEQLGKHDFTDILTVSYSSNDKVGHDYGMYSPEEREVTLQVDKLLDKLFRAVERQVGAENLLVILTADHGVSPSAEEAAANRMPGGRRPLNEVRDAIDAALVKKYGAGPWIAGNWDQSVFLNLETISKKKLDPAEVRRVAAEAAFAVPHISRVYTRDQLSAGALPSDEMNRRVMNGFNLRRTADISFLPDPYWYFTTSIATTHGTPFIYDTHVPIIFMGAGIRPGRYNGAVVVNDIAPTLATMLEIEIPGGSVGRVLTEMLVP